MKILDYLVDAVDRIIDFYSPSGFEATGAGTILWSDRPAAEYVSVTDKDPAVRNTLATIASERTGDEADIIFGDNKNQ